MEKEKTKKPDQVVFNEETNSYEAGIKPYATNVGAPAIAMEDVTTWKNANVKKVNHHFKTQFEAIKASYQEMMDQFEYNNLIYRAKFSFEPVVGEQYHLYANKGEEPFLSIIAPSECNFKHLGSFKLTTDKLWERTDSPVRK
ncbi:DUF2452 domain-containing protein [Altibacter sp.]|uniref:DUF2452 domain-containing protein n=1 Tax=Altibacter sp. TaxID=2024823 RepID=UPI00258CC071|nr:DUF2452 domain-containing protein [Altibacter sp.]MCW9036457.1 DUF2452 domain-containing protein [Altibacter sp.]